MKESYVIAIASTVPIIVIVLLLGCWWISFKRRVKSEDIDQYARSHLNSLTLQVNQTDLPDINEDEELSVEELSVEAGRRPRLESIYRKSISRDLMCKSRDSMISNYSMSARGSLTSREPPINLGGRRISYDPLALIESLDVIEEVHKSEEELRRRSQLIYDTPSWQKPEKKRRGSEQVRNLSKVRFLPKQSSLQEDCSHEEF